MLARARRIRTTTIRFAPLSVSNNLMYCCVAGSELRIRAWIRPAQSSDAVDLIELGQFGEVTDAPLAFGQHIEHHQASRMCQRLGNPRPGFVPLKWMFRFDRHGFMAIKPFIAAGVKECL